MSGASNAGDVALALEGEADDARDVRTLVEDLRGRVDDLVGEVVDLRDELEDVRDERDELRDRVDDLEARVDDVEAARDDEATVRWAGPNPADVEIVASETKNSVYPYQAITDKARADDVDELRERVDDVEEGRADVVVRSETDPDALPIESRIARQQAGDDSLSANEARAAVLFPTFGGRAQTTGGKMLVMTSDDVKQALADKTDVAKADWPNETVRRVMRWTAKLTSRDEETRDPRDESNLLTLAKRNGKLALNADRDEWVSWSNEAADRLGGEPA